MCGAPPAGLNTKAEWLKTSDGVRLYAVTAGTGDTTLVLAHESGGAGLCGWMQTMAYFAKAGVRTLAFNFRGYPPSDSPTSNAKLDDMAPDLQAAIDAAQTKQVFLMGASMGGAAAMANGWKLKGLDGLINLSGEQKLPLRNLDAIDNVGKLRVPFLIVSSKDDGYLPVKQAEQLARHSGSDDTELITYSGAYHGWDLLNVAPFRARVKSQLLLWLRDHSR